MQQDFLDQYHEELAYIKKQAQDFSRAHPRIASNIALGSSTAQDPLVNQLIESFAFVSSEIKHTLRHEHPSIGQSLLNILYPHFSRAFPACSIMQLCPSANLLSPLSIPRGTVFAAQQQQLNCRFQSCYDVELQPLRITDTEFSDHTHNQALFAQSSLDVSLAISDNVSIDQLQLQPLDIYIQSDLNVALSLYQMIMNQCIAVQIEDPQGNLIERLDASNIQALGYSKEHQLLPYPPQAAHSHQLLTEYFNFPQKFLFFRVIWDRIKASHYGNQFCLRLLFNATNSSLQRHIDPNSLALHCTPAINLFQQAAEPIHWDHSKTEYHIKPDHYTNPQDIGAYSVQTVKLLDQQQQLHTLQPFYGIHHNANANTLYWHGKSKFSWECGLNNIRGTELHLSLVNQQGQSGDLQGGLLTIELLCTNRDAPSRLGLDPETVWSFWQDDFANVCTLRCLQPFSLPTYPNIDECSLWRLLSHLSLQKMSYSDSSDLKSLLHEYLVLYNHNQDPALEIFMQSIDSMTATTVRRRHPHDPRAGFIQGTQVEISYDAQRIEWQAWYLFGTIVHHILSDSCAINSFVELTLSSKQPGEPTQWPAKLGQQPLL